MFALVVAGCSARAPGAQPADAASPRSTTVGGSVPGWLAYQTADGPIDRVHLVRMDGSQDHPIADALPGRTGHPDYSRDGRRLVFDQLSSEDGVDQLYISDPDGWQPRLLAECRPPRCLGQWEPSWSPDGQRLAISLAWGPMTDSGPARSGLAVVDVATQAVVPILDHPSRDGQDHFARWSPDGSTLVFWRERAVEDGSTQTAIFRIDVSGKQARQLTPWALLAGDPDWSPDGAEIVFSTRPLLVFEEQGQSELYLMKPDGTGRRQITHNGPDGPRATQPRWAPDGQSILFVQTSISGHPRHVYTVHRDGTHNTPVLAARSIYTHPILQPAPDR